jgi:hypothetical protein
VRATANSTVSLVAIMAWENRITIFRKAPTLLR